MAFPRHRPDASLDASPSFPALEREVLQGWKDGDTFRKSVAAREGCEEWVFMTALLLPMVCPHYGAPSHRGTPKAFFRAFTRCEESKCTVGLDGTPTVCRQS